MIFRIYKHSKHAGWLLLTESDNIDEFDTRDKWAFNVILERELDYIKQGNTMWDIHYDNHK